MPRRLNSRDRLDDFLLVERNFDRAVGRQDALGHRDAVAPFDQRPLLPRNFEMQREIVRPFVPADMEDVAEVARRQHADFGAVMLYGDVGGDRGAVNDQRNFVGTNAGDVAQLAQPLEHAFGLIVRRAGDLVHEDAMFRLENEVGIGAADVDAYARHGSPDRPAPPCQPRCTTPCYTNFGAKIVSIVRPCNPQRQARTAATADTHSSRGRVEPSEQIVVECILN